MFISFHCRSLLTERHSRGIRAGRGAGFTYPIPVASSADVAGAIDVGTIVRRSYDPHAIAVNIDVGRGSSHPGETHRIYPVRLPPCGAERDRWRNRLYAVSPPGIQKVD